MKKLTWFFALVLFAFFVNCGGSKTAKQPEQKQEKPRPTTQVTTPSQKPTADKSTALQKSSTAPSSKTEKAQPVTTETKPQPEKKIYERPASVSVIPADTTKKVSTSTAPTPTAGQPASSTPVASPADTATAHKVATPPEQKPVFIMKAPVSSKTTATLPPAQPSVPSPAAIKDTLRAPIVEKPLSLENLLFDDIYFDDNQWEVPSLTFNANYFISLSRVVKALKSDPQINVRLKGHTSLSKKEEKATEIALKRAVTIGKLILDLFPAQERDSVARRIIPVSMGSREPLVVGGDKNKEALNRRVSIELFRGKFSDLSLADYIKSHQALPKATAVKPAEKPQATITQPQVPRKQLAPAEVLYNQGIKLYDQKKWDEAISTFQDIIAFDSKNPLADNAQWWIGECYYQKQDYQKALTAYQQVFNLGDQNKAAYAQLRMGYCYWHLNQKENAKSEFEKVLNQYPDAQEEVAKAQKILKIIAQP